MFFQKLRFFLKRSNYKLMYEKNEVTDNDYVHKRINEVTDYDDVTHSSSNPCGLHRNIEKHASTNGRLALCCCS